MEIKIKYKKDFSNYQEYNDYLCKNIQSHIEYPLYQLARKNKIELEWQKEIKYYDENGNIKSFKCDFYYEDLTGDIKIAIECDGKAHNDEERKNNDFLRDETLRSKGICVLRFKSWQIWENGQDCINKILKNIKQIKNDLLNQPKERKFALKTSSEKNQQFVRIQ